MMRDATSMPAAKRDDATKHWPHHLLADGSIDDYQNSSGDTCTTPENEVPSSETWSTVPTRALNVNDVLRVGVNKLGSTSPTALTPTHQGTDQSPRDTGQHSVSLSPCENSPVLSPDATTANESYKGSVFFPLCPTSRFPQDVDRSRPATTCRSTCGSGTLTPLSCDEAACRICQDDEAYEKLVSPCLCSGTVGYVHVSCLNTWLQATSRTSCELCGYPFPVTRQPAPLREYLRNPRANMDLPNLICDVACLLVLTPLLFSSVYLSSTGTLHYKALGSTGSMCAVATLLLALLLVYLSWACLAVVYHLRVWHAWQEKNSVVSKLCESQIADKVDKMVPTSHRPAMELPNKAAYNLEDTDVHGEPVAADTAILLAPINRLSGWIRVNNRISITNPSAA